MTREEIAEGFTEAVLAAIAQTVVESKCVHPHDIMSQVLTAAEVLYKFTESLPGQMFYP